MKYFFLLFSLSLLLAAASACGTVHSLAHTSDSTRVEVRVERQILHDTAYVELPVLVERVATLDTASVLENKYAKSEASVSAGVLTHSLETKPVKEPVVVEKEIVYRDSLVYVDRVEKEDYYYELPPTRWQRFRMDLGLTFLILIATAVIYFLIKLILKLLKAKQL